MRISSTPNSLPVSDRMTSGMWSAVSPAWLSAHQRMIAAPTPLTASTATARRRSGTSTNHSSAPTTAAIRAPRE